jgi:hypothetical protein
MDNTDLDIIAKALHGAIPADILRPLSQWAERQWSAANNNSDPLLCAPAQDWTLTAC